LYYTRLVRSGRIAQLIAAASVLSVAIVAAAGQDTTRVEFVLQAGDPAHAQRIRDTAKRALELLTEWLGALDPDRLHIAESGGDVAIPRRWLSSSSDLALERAVIVGVARQFWTPTTSPVAAGIARYTALRAIHTLLDGRHFATDRYFGGFVPHTIRWVSWSPRATDRRPPYRWFSELQLRGDSEAEGERIAEALYTLERYIGWPATHQILSEARSRFRDRPLSSDDLAVIASEQSGRDLSWFFRDTFRTGHFDYAVTSLSSTRGSDATLAYHTVVKIERRGDGMFSGPAPASPGEVLRSLRVQTIFEDGEIATGWIDGRRGGTLEYRSASPAVSAAVDPDTMLLLDQDRTNNSVNLRPSSDPIGRRLAWHWWVWLQDLALTYAAIV
jgi:hypothetical protein